MAPKALARLRRLHQQLLAIMIVKPAAPTKVIFDLDSTILTVYGKQELARVGYNPAKRGRASYHPLLCFNGLTKRFLAGRTAFRFGLHRHRSSDFAQGFVR